MSTTLNEVFAKLEDHRSRDHDSRPRHTTQSCLNEMAPERMKAILVRPTNPWITEEVKVQKKAHEEQGMTMVEYKLQSNWIAFKADHNWY